MEHWDWDFGDGSNSTLQDPVLKYASGGDYIVCLTAGNAGGSDTKCEVVNTPTSVNNTDIQVLQIFPNPVNQNLLRSLCKISGHYSIEVSDILGQIVITKSGISSASKNLTLPIGGLSA